MKLPIKLCVASINYQRLDARATEALGAAKLQTDRDTIERIKIDLGFKVDQLCVIDKCNALIVVFTYYDDLLEDFVRGRLLATWDKLAHHGITDFVRDIKFIHDEDAIRYLAECAAGVHSVTLGDSQVLSQITDSLQTGITDSDIKSTFSILIAWIKETVYEVKIKTSFLSGNISLERIACEFLVQIIKREDLVTVLGYGKTGKLICKILTVDNHLAIRIANRSTIELTDEPKIPHQIEILDLQDFAAMSTSKIIINTISNNEATESYIDNLIKNISNLDDIAFIDLSSPSLLKGKVPRLYDIEYLSNIANENIKTRSGDITKVKDIIHKNFTLFLDAISGEYGKAFLRSQRNLKINKVEPEKLRLLNVRSELYKIIRRNLEHENFTEVTTPYIVGISTDPPKVDKGGTIDVEWQPGVNAFLRQSNQIYKQILVASGMDKIYEIGPFCGQKLLSRTGIYKNP